MKRQLTLSLTMAVTSQAAVLSGSGNNLSASGIPYSLAPSGVAPVTTVVGGGFTGEWSSSAEALWQARYDATGQNPRAGGSGSVVYTFQDFSGGTLPVGTLFLFSDLDGNSDVFTMRAYDTSNNQISLWLDEPVATWGTGTGGGAVQTTDLPGWSWQSGSQSYFFDGGLATSSNVVNAGFTLMNNQAIARLEVDKPSTSYGFGLWAPASVPEPSSAILLGLGSLTMLARRKRQ